MPVPASAEKIKPRITAARRRARRRLQRDSSSSGSDQSSSEEEEERSDDSGHEDDDFRQQFGPDLPPGDGNKGDKPGAAASALPLPPAKVTPKPKTRKERASLFSLFPSKKQRKALARSSTATMPEFGGKKGKIFDEYLSDFKSYAQSKGMPDLTEEWPLKELYISFDASTDADTLEINMPGHPLNGQTVPWDELYSYNKWVKNNIIHDKALVGEIKKNLKGAARDFLRGQSEKTLASAHLLLKAMIKRYHISADNKANHMQVVAQKLLHLGYNSSGIDEHNDKCRQILSDAKECNLGGIPENFIRQIYLKSLPTPQWDSFKLKMSGQDGFMIEIDSDTGERKTRQKSVDELMDAASQHKAMGFLPDDGERQNEAAFGAREKKDTGKGKKPQPAPKPRPVKDTDHLVCDNKKCGMKGHLRRWCTKPGGGLADASSEFKTQYYGLMRAFSQTKGAPRRPRRVPSSVAEPRTEAAYAAQIAQLEAKASRQKEQLTAANRKLRDIYKNGDSGGEDEPASKKARFDPYTGDRLFLAGEHALIAASDDKEDETTVYIDSMATSNFVAPNVDLSKAKTVNGPEVSIADGSSIKVKKTGLLDGLITAKGGRHGAESQLSHSFPCKTGPEFAHNLMSVKYWTGIGARVNFEKGNCYIAKATGEAPTEEHIPFDDVEGGYALRIQRKE